MVTMDDMPKRLEPRTVIYVLIAFVIVVVAATYFVDCDVAPCRGTRVTGWGGGGYTSLCVEN